MPKLDAIPDTLIASDHLNIDNPAPDHPVQFKPVISSDLKDKKKVHADLNDD